MSKFKFALYVNFPPCFLSSRAPGKFTARSLNFKTCFGNTRCENVLKPAKGGQFINFVQIKLDAKNISKSGFMEFSRLIWWQVIIKRKGLRREGATLLCPEISSSGQSFLFQSQGYPRRCRRGGMQYRVSQYLQLFSGALLFLPMEPVDR